ncbi:MAG: TcpQ domain-containing protein [Providencia rettgeri]|uniref:TcpQ domain-containing protein n=1 Tax=unclassified Providencia TaxID=2633465 RepID=UPI00234BBC06|nr:TcpQ domain-containing protein [Providencia sp. PROV164]
MKYKMSVFILCSLVFSSVANTTIGQQEWVNLKPMKEIKSVSDSSKTEQKNINIEQIPRDKKEGEEQREVMSHLILKKNELLSQSIEEWTKFNGIDFIWNSPKDIVIFNEITIDGTDRIQVLEKLGKQLSYQKAGFYLKFYEENNVLVIDN